MISKIEDLSKLCVHTLTTKPWDIETCVKNYSEAGINAITIWRNVLENKDLVGVKKMLDEYDMEVVSLARGGFFPSVEQRLRNLAIDDNLWAIEQAVAIGAPMIVLVCGTECGQSLEKSREQIAEGILKVLPAAQRAGIRLAIEPLHPMYAGDRSAINTLRQANEMAEMIHSKWVGVAVDVYHLWWDPDLKSEIQRCAANDHLFAFHVSDWNATTSDFLNDRGLMGDGCINVPEIRSWVEETGFSGYNEVEVFSNKYWATDQKEYLEKIKVAYLTKT